MTDTPYPMTNAELAQAIADTRTYVAVAHIASESRLFFDHLSELLRIQRERAALPVPKYSVVASGDIDLATGKVTPHPPVNVGRFGVQPE